MNRFRAYRYLLGINLPPILGALLFYSYIDLKSHGSISLIDSGEDPFLPLRALVELIGIAYIFIGIQAIIATSIMEFFVLKKWRSFPVRIFSAIGLGILSGATLVELEFVVIGSIVGFFAGLGLIIINRREALVPPQLTETTAL
ncbi:hypothetical protein [Pleionea litopenaei]|uniref:Uncharacterized protein n=1 Tax=Pleionea litopenaei TaxID=3070815 RepID=A0AA51RWN8_9GAMM|nr:hypothetical protein [Pleionea sp. HL-JVS1]WMS88950.1 hypothetical protein Q9312_08550 [Pleionea sp. HL-JVS1]